MHELIVSALLPYISMIPTEDRIFTRNKNLFPELVKLYDSFLQNTTYNWRNKVDIYEKSGIFTQSVEELISENEEIIKKLMERKKAVLGLNIIFPIVLTNANIFKVAIDNDTYQATYFVQIVFGLFFSHENRIQLKLRGLWLIEPGLEGICSNNIITVIIVKVNHLTLLVKKIRNNSR